MDKIGPESIAWLDKLSAVVAELKKQPPPTYADLAKTLKTSKGMIANYAALHPLFDPAALTRIRQEAAGNPPNILSLGKALALTGLNGKVSDLPESVYEALDIIYSRHLDPRHIEGLAEHMVSGNPTNEFDHTQVKYKKRKKKTTEDKIEGRTFGQLLDDALKAITGFFSRRTSNLSTDEQRLNANNSKHKNNNGAKKVDRSGIKATISHFANWIHQNIKEGSKVTASYFCPLHSHSSASNQKHGSNQPFPNPISFLTHWAIYWISFWFLYSSLVSILGHFIPFLGPWIDKGLAILAHWLLSLPLWLLAWLLANPKLALVLGAALLWWFHQAFRTGLQGTLVIAALLVAAWYFHGWWLGKLGIKLPSTTSSPKVETAQSPQPEYKSEEAKHSAPVPSSRAVAKTHLHSSAPKVLTQNSSTPTSLYQPSRAAKPEESESIEAEVGSFPAGSTIKDFKVEPDPNMGEEMATRRLGDIADSEQYSFMVGHDKKKVLSATPSPTGLTLELEGGLSLGGLSGGLLGDSPKKGQSIYWEDLQAIRCYRIATPSENPQETYRCELIVSGIHRPLTFQCLSARACEHLISALEYWVRAAQKGQNAPLTGLPYLNQGVLLNNDSTWKIIWEKSPLGRGGLAIGDKVWSLDSNMNNQQSWKDIETALPALSPGKHTLYFVTLKDWIKAKLTGDFHNVVSFNPKRQSLELEIP